ncbi:hypothetical protein [Microvirga lotononidis]|uniref:hypothetical protein n=1 Tax=Microvirga lotononidis TaxID=864069 RepID=UPI0012B51A21|nr:hypothetical protein [Microvirga lotononidis]WQO27397.1 hypothetical protein U0023_22610 [Microvirga lotononidis]
MTDEEIEAVAEELAKAGGTSWYPGRTRGALLRSVSERYRDRARLAIAALDRVRAGHGEDPSSQSPETVAPPAPASANYPDGIQVGATVVYRPPGDQRAITCRIEQLENGRAYLVPVARSDVGWVALDSFDPVGEAPTKDE